jgi:hypothetical protein
MRTLGSSITKWLYNENDKCDGIRNNMAEKFAGQQKIHAFIPETWNYCLEEKHQQMIPTEEALNIYRKLQRDMDDRYRIDIEKMLLYGQALLNASYILKIMYSVMPIKQDSFLAMTGLYDYIEYMNEEFEPHVLRGVIEPIFMLLMDWKKTMDRQGHDGTEYFSYYNSTEAICRNMYAMWGYCVNVFDMMQAFIKEADGIVFEADGGNRFAKIDDARQFIDDMKGAAISIYTDAVGMMDKDIILDIIERHQVQGTCADDSPMNDNRSNAIAMSVLLVVGLAILLAVSLFFFPRLFIPIIVIAVVLEVVNNIIPQKK